MPRGPVINSALYLQALETLQMRFRIVGHHINIAEIPLQHNARPHTRFKTQEAITKL